MEGVMQGKSRSALAKEFTVLVPDNVKPYNELQT